MLTKVFYSGNSQAIRIPKEFRFNTNEVEIFKHDNEVIIREKPKNLARAFELFTSFPDDFFKEERRDDLPQERDML